MNEQYLKSLSEQRAVIVKNLEHAINNERNPYANNGTERVAQWRKELALNTELFQKATTISST